MKVLIYEPYGQGHRFHYVSLLVPTLSTIGCEVLLATTKSATQSKEFEIHLTSLASPASLNSATEQFEIAEIEESKPGSSMPFVSRSEAKRLSQVLSQTRPDHLMIPTASQIALTLSSTFAFRKSFGVPDMTSQGLFMGPGYGYDMGRSKNFTNHVRKVVERNLPLTKYGHLDPFQLNVISRNGKEDRFQVMPDPAPRPPKITKQEAQEHFGIPTDGRYIGCTGAISVDKGIIDLIKAYQFAESKLESTDRLLFVGMFSQQMKDYVREEGQELIKSGKMICIDRLLSEHEMDIVFTAFDLICAAHHGRPGSSGVVLRAAAAGVPILSRQEYWSGRIVPMFDLGWTCSTRQPETFAEGLLHALDQLDKYQQTENSKKYVAFQSVENFQAHWTELVRKRMGIESDPNLIEWVGELSGIQSTKEKSRTTHD